jgi:hypothetical protein
VLLAATFRSGNWLFYRLRDDILAFLRLIEGVVALPLTIKQRVPPPLPGEGTPAPQKTRGKGWAVLRGVLLALPVLAVLTALLASADFIFAQRVKDLFSIFNFEKLPEYLFRLFYILVIGYVLVGAYFHASFPLRSETRPNPQQPWMKPFLGWTEGAIVLASVDVLFAIFVGFQSWYLFGGQANITTAGYTYAEYARRGFNELVAVAVLSVMLYLVMRTVVKRETMFQQRGFTVLVAALMALVLVILISAFQRLQLYENAYGLSQIRLYTHIFIPWLAVLLVSTAVLEVLRKGGHFALAALICVTGFCLTFPIINVDGLIARQNVARAQSGQKLDGYYLSTLSVDAVPAMFQSYSDASLPVTVHDQLGSALACQSIRTGAYYKHLGTTRNTGWQSFNLARQQADQLLTAQSGDLVKRYLTEGSDGVWNFVSSDLSDYHCWATVPGD